MEQGESRRLNRSGGGRSEDRAREHRLDSVGSGIGHSASIDLRGDFGLNCLSGGHGDGYNVKERYVMVSDVASTPYSQRDQEKYTARGQYRAVRWQVSVAIAAEVAETLTRRIAGESRDRAQFSPCCAESLVHESFMFWCTCLVSHGKSPSSPLVKIVSG